MTVAHLGPEVHAAMAHPVFYLWGGDAGHVSTNPKAPSGQRVRLLRWLLRHLLRRRAGNCGGVGSLVLAVHWRCHRSRSRSRVGVGLGHVGLDHTPTLHALDLPPEAPYLLLIRQQKAFVGLRWVVMAR